MLLQFLVTEGHEIHMNIILYIIAGSFQCWIIDDYACCLYCYLLETAVNSMQCYDLFQLHSSCLQCRTILVLLIKVHVELEFEGWKYCKCKFIGIAQ